MNSYLIVGVMLAWIVSIAGTAYLAFDYGESSTIAQQKKQEDLVRETREAAQQGAAAAIAKLKPVNTTIQQKVLHEIERETIYRDCRVPADGVRLANDALAGRTQPAAGGKLPGADAAPAKP